MSIIKKIIKRFVPQVLLDKRRSYLHDKLRVKFHRNCKELLELTDDILAKANIPFWLNYGTLLGAYRDHNFIPHDYDLDVALFWEDNLKVKKIMLESGLTLKHEVRFGDWENPENIEYRFEYKGAYIDFNFYVVENNVATTYNPLFIEGVEYTLEKKLPVIAEKIDNPFNGLSKIQFLGRDYYIPANTEDYLTANYGESFMTPIKNFNYHDVANNITACNFEDKRSYIYIYTY